MWIAAEFNYSLRRAVGMFESKEEALRWIVNNVAKDKQWSWSVFEIEVVTS